MQGMQGASTAHEGTAQCTNTTSWHNHKQLHLDCKVASPPIPASPQVPASQSRRALLQAPNLHTVTTVRLTARHPSCNADTARHQWHLATCTQFGHASTASGDAAATLTASRLSGTNAPLKTGTTLRTRSKESLLSQEQCHTRPN
jgi:hypothetical protein